MFQLVVLASIAVGAAPPCPTQARVEEAFWTPATQLVLNVPATRLDVWRGDSLVGTYRVAVGTRKYPTPTGEFEITELIWNPRWVPPPGEWAANEKPQAPGPHNNMGRVKLQFGPYLYLHGSPYTNSIGQAASHGCVRLRNTDAIELAQIVLSLAGPQLSADLLDLVITDTTATLPVRLDHPLPLTIRYDVAEVRGSALEVHTDLYRRGVDVRQEALAALAAHGYNEPQVNLARLDTFLKQRKRPNDRIALRELLGSGALVAPTNKGGS